MKTQTPTHEEYNGYTIEPKTPSREGLTDIPSYNKGRQEALKDVLDLMEHQKKIWLSMCSKEAEEIIKLYLDLLKAKIEGLK